MIRRPYPRFLAYLPLVVVLVAWLASWGVPVLDEHGFRQTQTLVSSYWMTRGGDWWLYSTPVLGYPWSVPFEFPLYQWGVAMLAMLPVGLDIDAAGRLLSLLAMVGCLWPLRQGLRGLGAPERLIDISTALFLLSPLHVFWGRAAMIESTVLLLSMLFVVAVQRLVAGVTLSRCLFAIVLAALAALVKVTTFFGFALLAGAIVAAALFPRLRSRDWASAATLAGASALPIVMALVALLVWLEASDRQKLVSVLAEFSTTDNLSGWNFRPQLLIEIHAFWRDVVLRRMLPDILGNAAWLLCLAPLLLLPGRRRWLGWLAGALALFLAPMVVFTNLHFVHDYYQMANAVFLVVALSVVLHAVSANWSATGVVALTVLAGAGMLVQFHGDYWRSIRSVDPLHRASVLAAVLREHTAPDDAIVTMGLAWSSEVPYYAQRRAVMLLQDNFQPFVPAALRASSAGGEDALHRLGAIVRCGEERSDISSLLPQFCGPLREIEAAGCSIIVRRDAGASSPGEAECEARRLRDVQAQLAPRPAEALVLGPFSREWISYEAMDRCNIEFVGVGVTPATRFTRGQPLSVTGWFLDQATGGRPSHPTLRLRSKALGRSWYAPLDDLQARPDLAAAYGAQAKDGGFRVTLSLEDLPPGNYQLLLVDLQASSPGQCLPHEKNFVLE
ncbi:hypothetical protein [Arenimonas alkanexedens]